LDAPFVEYKGKIPPDEVNPLLQRLQMVFQELLDEDIPTEIRVLDKDEAQQTCDRIKENYFKMDLPLWWNAYQVHRTSQTTQVGDYWIEM
jgi:hypothetical protein